MPILKVKRITPIFSLFNFDLTKNQSTNELKDTVKLTEVLDLEHFSYGKFQPIE